MDLKPAGVIPKLFPENKHIQATVKNIKPEILKRLADN